MSEGEGHESAERSTREELRALVGAARAWLELHRDAGTFGLPSGVVLSAGDEPGDDFRPLASVVSLNAHAAADAFGAPAGPSAPTLPPSARNDSPRPGPAAAPPPAARNYEAQSPAARTYDPEAPDPAAAFAGPPADPSPGAAPQNDVTSRPARPVAATANAPAAAQSALFSVGLDARPLRPGVALGVETPADPEAKLVRLQVLAGEAAGCTRCRLHEGRTKSVFARGNPRARIMFVGEGPGADEDAQGLPFVGRAGQLLDKMVAAMGLRQDDIYIANVVKCRPPQNRKPEPDEMSACVPYLAEQIALLEPEVIIALGGTAAEGLLGGRVAITRARGQWRLYRATIPVMPTYHPAYLLRNPPAKREVWDDLRAVLQRLGRAVPGKSG